MEPRNGGGSSEMIQGQLNFVHRTAQTSRLATAGTIRKRDQRAIDAMDQLSQAGTAGLTRHELADLMRIPLSSVCSLAARMIENGQAVEAGDTRLSPFGHAAKILRHSTCADATNWNRK